MFSTLQLHDVFFYAAISEFPIVALDHMFNVFSATIA